MARIIKDQISKGHKVFNKVKEVAKRSHGWFKDTNRGTITIDAGIVEVIEGVDGEIAITLNIGVSVKEVDVVVNFLKAIQPDMEQADDGKEEADKE